MDLNLSADICVIGFQI